MLFENLTQIMNQHFENNVAPSSLPSSPPLSPKPSTPNNTATSSSSLSEQSTEVDTPIIEREPSPIPTPAQWRRVKEVQEAAKVLTDISHPTKASSIGSPPRNPHRVPGWWQHLTLNQTLDPYLAAESVQNTLWSHTPVVTASRLTRLWTYSYAITSNLYSDQSAMQMEDFITTLSAIEWAEGDSSPVTCDASTFNSAYDYAEKDGNVLVADFERSDIERGGTSGQGKVALLECFNASTKDPVSAPTSPVPEQAVDTERPFFRERPKRGSETLHRKLQ
ncbi:hypothetical protein B9Z19DRAFT_1129577 [Tuber borchii]|uniref:Uncharacterized protein n=1 Tax=Tuber borchii TaxID=42251 RepID=A0A2T6ZM73_TUBBO|nr:hypothetical protein B9Z19DRAFT_1129577 [Tuber borchii]